MRIVMPNSISSRLDRSKGSRKILVDCRRQAINRKTLRFGRRYMNIRRAVLPLVFCFLASFFVRANDSFVTPAGVSRGVSVEGMDEYSLANGLKVLLFQDPTKPTITVNVTYLVGSRHENYGEAGMAHLLEHLMFKGSPRHVNIPQELTADHPRPNGTTSYDRTNYFETFAASDDNLGWALDLEADRMVNSFIAKKDLDSEMTVVRNEFEAGENDPSHVLFRRVMSMAYLWHNYGKPTIGARSDIENVSIEKLQAFYRNWYQSDNSVLLVAGNFDPEKTLALIQEKFGSIPKPSRQMMTTYTREPAQDGERLVTLRRVGDTQDVIAAYHVPAASHADSPALDVLSHILGDTPSGRLHKTLVETKKASSVFSFNFALREPGLMLFGATTRKEQSLDEAGDILLKTIEDSAATTFSAEEVERAKTSLLKDIDITLNSADRVGLEMSEWLAVGDWRLFFINRDRIKTLTPDDVQRVASAYLKPANRTLGLFIPTAKPERVDIPETPDVSSLVKDYKGGESLASGEAFDPSPENIDRLTVRNALKDGLKLALLPKKTRGATIHVALSLNIGDEESLKGQAVAGRLAGEMLMRGTARHTRQQLQDEFDRLKTRVSVDGSATGVNAFLETDRKNIVSALRLIAEVLREPAFKADEFEMLRQEELVSLEQEKNDPISLARIAFSRQTAPYLPEDVRYTPTLPEQIERVKSARLDDVKAFHTGFYGASSGQLALVGDFDPQEMQQLAEELFGGWTSVKSFRRIQTEWRDIAPAQLSLETPDKANAFMVAGMNFAMRDDDPDYPALSLANFMAGGGFLNSRLASRIREKDGLSYYVGSSLRVHSEDSLAWFNASAIYAPQNAEKLEKALREELTRISETGFTSDEMREAKTGWLQGRKVERSQDRSLARQLSQNEYLGRTMAWQGDLEKKVDALSSEQAREAFTWHIKLDKFTFVRSGSFAGSKTDTILPKQVK